MKKKMDNQLEAFLANTKSVQNYSPELKALWYDGNGDWQKAHDEVDHLSGQSAARVHAYLHRKEGDTWNSDYWYRRAGEVRPAQSLEEEWIELVSRYWLKK
ncbi:hypothetical protein [Algoriphagus sp. CAU 1675]|uniref:hypothetical protein n=1 Tax=Algoriphagus sp. CAU 1675 TaxID=3032597 RepID=UPI0023DA9AC3|nr:hypothetical protein [Algoriphagus sp. CAU 1675]MDF2158557.1 hypothetical protein [Algoriphagus sp. CAU 1675]